METLLPPKPKVDIPTGENVDEVSMMDFENTKGSSKSKSKGGAGGMPNFSSMMEEDDEDDEEGGAGQRVQCNTH